MASFHTVGVIATDVVRRETKQGVLSTFRLVSGAIGRGRLWIDVETWGRPAGVLNAHGHTGRGIALTGRLTQKAWRDKTTNQARSRLVVTADNFDLLAPDLRDDLDIPNHVVASGRVTQVPTSDRTSTTEALGFNITCGHAGAKTGRLDLPVRAWGRTLDAARHIAKGDDVAVAGRLSYQPDNQTRGHGRFYLSLYNIAATAPHTQNIVSATH